MCDFFAQMKFPQNRSKNADAPYSIFRGKHYKSVAVLSYTKNMSIIDDFKTKRLEYLAKKTHLKHHLQG
jgi:hypothetical protein